MPFDYDAMIAQENARYQQVVGGYQQRYDNAMKLTDTLGQNQLSQANRYYDQRSADTVQDAVARGLNNTTVKDSLQRGVDAQRGIDIGAINNDIAGQKLQIGAQLSGDQLGYQERGAAQNAQYGMNLYGLQQQKELSQQQLGLQAQGQANQYNLGMASLAMQHNPPVTTNSTGGGSWGAPLTGPGAVNYHPGYY